MDSTNQQRFIRRPEVERRSGLKRERIRQLEKLGQFPRRIPISPTCNVWVEAEIDQWIADRIYASRQSGHVAEGNNADPK